jgi:hypothetical protein
VNITTYTSKRESIVKVRGRSLGLSIIYTRLTLFVEDSYRETEIMKFSRHSNRDVYHEAYMTLLLVNSQASYWNKEQDIELIDSF